MADLRLAIYMGLRSSANDLADSGNNDEHAIYDRVKPCKFSCRFFLCIGIRNFIQRRPGNRLEKRPNVWIFVLAGRGAPDGKYAVLHDNLNNSSHLLAVAVFGNKPNKRLIDRHAV